MPQQPGNQPILSLGPFAGLNTTSSPFYLKEGDGTVVSNFDITQEPGALSTSYGRELAAVIPVPESYVVQCVVPFSTYYGSQNNDGTIGEVSLLVWSAFNETTGDAIAGWVDPVAGGTGELGHFNFTQAVQFSDSLYTNDGHKIYFDPSGQPKGDVWQIQVDDHLPYNIMGAPVSGSGAQGTFQYAYTIRRAANWRTKQNQNGAQAFWNGSITAAANGFLTFTLTYMGETFTTEQFQFIRNKKNPGISVEEFSDQVCATMVQVINSDPSIGQLVQAFVGTSDQGTTPDNAMYVQVIKPGSDGNNYAAFLTITNPGGGNSASPSSSQSFQGGSNQGVTLTTLDPDLATYQESSPVLTPQFVVGGGSAPALVCPQNVNPNSMVTGNTPGGETYYGYLYRSSFINPTYVGVDYLINLQTTTTSGGLTAFIDPYTDTEIENNVILTQHNDPPPIIGQVFPGPALTQLSPNGGPPNYFQQSDLKIAFPYTNPATMTKHQTRMFLLTMYPQMPAHYSATTPWRNRIQFQPQLWYSDYGVPWAYDDVNQLLLVGSEDASGNYQLGPSNGAPWSPLSQLTDIPVGMASTGSILVIFKRRSCWILFGDSPQEFQQGLRESFDIGAYGSGAIVAAEGGVFWLSDEPLGFYFFNGNAPSYISEDIRASLQELKVIDELEACTAGYDGVGHIYYASFAPSTNPDSPAYQTGITFCYATALQKWFSLPYGSNILFNAPIGTAACGIATPSPTVANRWNLSYLRSSVQDLGVNVTGVWQTGVAVGARRGVRKSFREIVLLAPQQAADVTVTLFVDGVDTYSYTWQLDADKNKNDQWNGLPWARVATLPPNVEGYTAYATLSLTNRGNVPAQVYAGDITYVELGDLQSTANNDGTFDDVSP